MKIICSFCGKTEDQVFIVKGPAVFICEECVGVCSEISKDHLQEAWAKRETETGHKKCICGSTAKEESVAYLAQANDMKRQLHEAWAERDEFKTEADELREVRDELQRQLDHAWERLGLEDPRQTNKAGCPRCGVTAGHAENCEAIAPRPQR